MNCNPLAWLVVDPDGRRAIFTDEARADHSAVRQHAIKVELYRAGKAADAVAWLVGGHRGARVAVLRADRAEQLARDVGGVAAPLAPLVPLGNQNPDGEKSP